jgi:hypothetical protein
VADLTCTSASDSQAGSEFKCNDGFYLQDNAAPTPDTCEPCTPIANSNNQGLKCKSATSTQAASAQFACNPGYYLVDNAAPTADTCEKCPGIPNSNNVGVQCGAGGADLVGILKNGFACDAGHRVIYSTVLPGFAVGCTKCPDILNSNNVGLACGDSGVCWQVYAVAYMQSFSIRLAPVPCSL